MQPEGLRILPCVKSLPLSSISSQINPIHSLLSYFLKINFNIIFPLESLPSEWIFLSVSPTRSLYAFLLFPIGVTWPACLILLGWNIQIKIFGVEQRLWSKSICSFLRSSVSSSLLNPNIFLSNLFSNTLFLCPFLNMRDQVTHTYKTTDKGTFLCFKSLGVIHQTIIQNVLDREGAHIYWI